METGLAVCEPCVAAYRKRVGTIRAPASLGQVVYDGTGCAEVTLRALAGICVVNEEIRSTWKISQRFFGEECVVERYSGLGFRGSVSDIGSSLHVASGSESLRASPCYASSKQLFGEFLSTLYPQRYRPEWVTTGW